MSFLAPWFVLGGIAAVSLPVLFHFFRRTPRGRLPFSTLMFLTPSPPRVTSRSRLENLPLLLLRAGVLVLLALAFGRPLWRQLLESQADVPLGTRTVLLIDTSASMRRGDLRAQALGAATKIVDAAGPHDELCLMTFDSAVRTPLSLDAWRAAPVEQRAGLARAALGGLQLSWSATRLDRALLSAAEVLDGAAERGTGSAGAPAEAARVKKIVLVTDLQSGSRTAALQSHEWPKRVEVRVVALETKTVNAGVHPLETTEGAPTSTTGATAATGAPAAGSTAAGSPAAGATVPGAAAGSASAAPRPRVLVTNSADSTRESFTLTWQQGESKGAASTTDPAVIGDTVVERSIDAYVPPGQTRVVRAAAPPAGEILKLVLAGDDEPFDNQLWFVPPTAERLRVLHLSAEKADDPQSLRYFLERAFDDTAAVRRVGVFTVDPHAAGVRSPVDRDFDDVALVVTSGDVDLPADWSREVGAWIERGGVSFSVIPRASGPSWAGRSLLPGDLAADGRIAIEEAKPAQGYALLGQIDLKHPLFAPLDDPRYSDFTKIRFWRHRKLTLDKQAQEKIRVLARFDSGEPALLETPRGKGRVVVLAAGWQPRESQLGVSSKFVPIVTTLADLGRPPPPRATAYEAGEPIQLSQLGILESLASADAGQGSGSQSNGASAPPAAAAPSDIVPPSAEPTTLTPSAAPAGPWTVKHPDGHETTLSAGATRFEPPEPGVYEIRRGAGLRRFAVNVPADESKTGPLGVEPLEALGVRLERDASESTAAAPTVTERQTLQLRELESRQQLWRFCLVGALGVVIVETWYAGRVTRRENVFNLSNGAQSRGSG